ncbi:O-antigen ligase family protein [Thalassobellus suaedae]
MASIGIVGAGLFGIYHFKKDSSDGRAFIWKVTTEIMADAPVFGVDFDRFKANYMNYQADYFEKNGETPEALVADNTYYAFNEWLQYAVENGLTGGVFLALFLYALFKVNVDKKEQFMVAISFSGLLAISGFALFSYPMQILPIKMIIVILLGFLSVLDRRKYKILNIQNKPHIPVFFKATVFILGTIGIVKGVEYANSLDRGFETWQNALNKYRYGDYDGALEDYAKAYPVFRKEGDFLMNYGKALSIAEQYGKAVGILEEAKQHLNTTIIETALGDAYKGLKQYDKAETAYYHAVTILSIVFTSKTL